MIAKINPLAGEIAQARLTPGGWVYRIAGRFSEDQEVPPEAIIGAWQVDANGCIIGDFQKNPNYDEQKWPSPGITPDSA